MQTGSASMARFSFWCSILTLIYKDPTHGTKYVLVLIAEKYLLVEASLIAISVLTALGCPGCPCHSLECRRLLEVALRAVFYRSSSLLFPVYNLISLQANEDC